jgi:hypothetical protein
MRTRVREWALAGGRSTGTLDVTMRSLLALTALCTGCATPEVLLQTPSEFADVTDASIASARQRWEASGISDYDYSPECHGWIRALQTGARPRVVVKEQRVVHSQYFDDFLDLRNPPTVEEIFTEMQRILRTAKYRQGTVAFSASFDQVTGIPTHVYLGDTDLYDSWEDCSITHVRIWAPKKASSPTASVTSNLRWGGP